MSTLKLHSNSALVHSIFEWTEVQGTHLRCEYLFVDDVDEISSGLKYLPLLEATKNLIFISLVDLVIEKNETRVIESFAGNFFKDRDVVIYCVLDRGGKNFWPENAFFFNFHPAPKLSHFSIP